MSDVRHRTGWVEVITGPMFSGKSEELIRRLRRVEIARQRLQTFKPAIDDRFHATDIVSHNQQRMPGETVASSAEILARVDEATEVVGIDEGQFFDQDLVEVCNILAKQGKRVIVAGLDQDYRGRPFGPMPAMMAAAEYVTKQLAICVICGNPANHTQRLTGSRAQIQVGAQGLYEARCRCCFQAPPDESPSA